MREKDKSREQEILMAMLAGRIQIFAILSGRIQVFLKVNVPIFLSSFYAYPTVQITRRESARLVKETPNHVNSDCCDLIMHPVFEKAKPKRTMNHARYIIGRHGPPSLLDGRWRLLSLQVAVFLQATRNHFSLISLS